MKTTKLAKIISFILLCFSSLVLGQETIESDGLSSLKEAKFRIENTVPMVLRTYKVSNRKPGIQQVRIELEREYINVASKYDGYKDDVSNCILINNTLKKSQTCIKEKATNLKNGLINYDKKNNSINKYR